MALLGIGLASSIYAAPIDINTADADTIIAGTTGIGPTRARAIINYREQHGPFATVDDITKVFGMGKKLLEQNRANLTVGAPTPPADKAAKSSPNPPPANSK